MVSVPSMSHSPHHSYKAADAAADAAAAAADGRRWLDSRLYHAPLSLSLRTQRANDRPIVWREHRVCATNHSAKASLESLGSRQTRE